MALNFDGSTSYGFTQSLNFSNSLYFSLSFWHKPSHHAADRILIESSSNSNTNAGSFAFVPNSSQSGGASLFRINKNGTATHNFYIIPAVPENQWHHYVCNIDTTQTGQQISVYVNNALYAGSHLVGAGSGTNGGGNYVWNLGARNASITPTIFAQGSIAELAIFTGILLNTDQVNALYYGVDPLELLSDPKPYYWKMEGDLQLVNQDSSAQSSNLTTVNIGLVYHPPISVDFFGWDEVPFFLSTQQVGQILEGSFNVVAELNSENNATKSIDAIINILDQFHTILNSTASKSSSVSIETITSNQHTSVVNKLSNISVEYASNIRTTSSVDKFGSITIGAVTQFNEFITVNRSVSLQTFGTVSFNQLATVHKIANIDIGLSTNLDVILGSVIIGGFEFNCAISNQCLPAVVKQTTVAIDNVFNQIVSGRKDSSAEINIDGSFNETILGSILSYTVIDIRGESYIQLEVDLQDNSPDFRPLKVVYITMPLDTMVEKILKIH